MRFRVCVKRASLAAYTRASVETWPCICMRTFERHCSRRAETFPARISTGHFESTCPVTHARTVLEHIYITVGANVV